LYNRHDVGTITGETLKLNCYENGKFYLDSNFEIKKSFNKRYNTPKNEQPKILKFEFLEKPEFKNIKKHVKKHINFYGILKIFIFLEKNIDFLLNESKKFKTFDNIIK
jgi:hypothetical protein